MAPAVRAANDALACTEEADDLAEAEAEATAAGAAVVELWGRGDRSGTQERHWYGDSKDVRCARCCGCGWGHGSRSHCRGSSYRGGYAVGVKDECENARIEEGRVRLTRRIPWS